MMREANVASDHLAIAQKGGNKKGKEKLWKTDNHFPFQTLVYDLEVSFYVSKMDKIFL